MTYRGHVENGVVVFDEPCDLPDGTPVLVYLVETPGQAAPADGQGDAIGPVEEPQSGVTDCHDDTSCQSSGKTDPAVEREENEG